MNTSKLKAIFTMACCFVISLCSEIKSSDDIQETISYKSKKEQSETLVPFSISSDDSKNISVVKKIMEEELDGYTQAEKINILSPNVEVGTNSTNIYRNIISGTRKDSPPHECIRNYLEWRKERVINIKPMRLSFEIKSSEDEDISSSSSYKSDYIDAESLFYLKHPNQLLIDMRENLAQVAVSKKQVNEIEITYDLSLFYFSNFEVLSEIYKPKVNDNLLTYHQRLHSSTIKKQLREVLQKNPKIKNITIFKLPQIEAIYSSGNDVELFLETAMKLPFQLLSQAYTIAKTSKAERSFFTTAFQAGCIAKKSDKLSKWIISQERKSQLAKEDLLTEKKCSEISDASYVE